MARRGEHLRTHILWSAKDVFLELGFERTSMDEVARRAETSKRSLYAHFPSKDALFAGVVELVRELYLGQIGSPEDYSDDPAEAAALYCARLLQLLLWTPSLRTLRLGVAESDRSPEAASGIHEAIFEIPTTRLAAHLVEHRTLPAATAREIAEILVGRAVHAELVRGLLGVRPSIDDHPDTATLSDDAQLDALRALVGRLLPLPD